jgi:hypothetical protein
MAKKFMYGIGSLQFKAQLLGYILKGSFQLGGTKGESSPVWAEQVQSAPVLSLPGSNGTINPTFNLIELSYEAMQALLGGELIMSGATAIGWKAPSESIVLTGEFIIETKSGQRITIFNGLLQANLGGNLEMTSVSQIEVTITPQLAEGDDTTPFKIEDIPAAV